MRDRRALLVGECAPHGGEPLDPREPNGPGARLYTLLAERCPDFSPDDFCKEFERVNLCEGRLWDAAEAERRAREFWPTWQGRTAVLLGRKVARACGLGEEKQPVLPRLVGGVVVRLVPNPSEIDRWYNDPVNRGVVGALLEELAFTLRTGSSSVG